ncbi:hypothetical protein H0H87_001554 [Tephrocybe sp. NHM501043]|nr:hypothetical protein H0H87_001554 [Tephrocybe sp. NHM501043]
MDNTDNTASSWGDADESGGVWPQQANDSDSFSDQEPSRNSIFDHTMIEQYTPSEISTGSRESSRINIPLNLHGSPSADPNVTFASQNSGDVSLDSPTNTNFLPGNTSNSGDTTLNLTAVLATGPQLPQLRDTSLNIPASPNVSTADISVGQGTASMNLTSIIDAAGIPLPQSRDTSANSSFNLSRNISTATSAIDAAGVPIPQSRDTSINSSTNLSRIGSQPSSGAPSPAKSIKSRTSNSSPSKGGVDDSRPSSRMPGSANRRERSSSRNSEKKFQGGRRESISSIGSGISNFNPPLDSESFQDYYKSAVQLQKVRLSEATLKERVENLSKALQKAEDALKEEKARAQDDKARADKLLDEEKARVREEKAKAKDDRARADKLLDEEKARVGEEKAKAKDDEVRADKLLDEEKVRVGEEKARSKEEKDLYKSLWEQEKLRAAEDRERLRKLEARLEEAEAKLKAK